LVIDLAHVVQQGARLPPVKALLLDEVVVKCKVVGAGLIACRLRVITIFPFQVFLGAPEVVVFVDDDDWVDEELKASATWLTLLNVGRQGLMLNLNALISISWMPPIIVILASCH